MNGRKAKSIRRLAQERTVGLPDRAYEDYTPPQFYNKNALTIAPAQWMKTTKGVPLRMAACTRLFTKGLKKEVRR